MCGIAGILRYRDGPRVDERDVLASARRAAPPRPGRRGALALRGRARRRSAIAGSRSSISRRRPPADGDARTAAARRLQRRDLQLPRAARGARRARSPRSRRPATPRCCCTASASGATALLDRLRGMFAFALYDARARRDCCSRAIRSASSRSTIADDGGGSSFASEVRAICARPRTAAASIRRGSRRFLLWGSVAPPRTLYRGDPRAAGRTAGCA